MGNTVTRNVRFTKEVDEVIVWGYCIVRGAIPVQTTMEEYAEVGYNKEKLLESKGWKFFKTDLDNFSLGFSKKTIDDGRIKVVGGKWSYIDNADGKTHNISKNKGKPKAKKSKREKKK